MRFQKARFALFAAVLAVISTTTSGQNPPEDVVAQPAPAPQEVERPDYSAIFQTARPSGPVQPNVADTGTNGDVLMTSPAPYTTSGVLLRSQPGWPNVAVKLGGTGTAGAFSIFDSSDRKLFSVDGEAVLSLGIGGGSSGVSCCPGRMLLQTMRADQAGGTGGAAWRGLAITDMWDGTMVLRILSRGPGETGGVAQIATDYTGRSLSFATGAFTEAMRINPNQNVGIGTSTPGARLHVRALSDLVSFPGTPTTMRIESSHPYNTVNNGSGISFNASYTDTAATTIAIISGVKESTDLGNYAGALTFGTRLNGSGAGSTERMRIRSTGEVVIGQPGDTARRLTVNGEFMATRVIGAVYQDLAEWVPASTDMPPGTVVVLNRERSNEVMASFEPYDSTVAGVVSAQPGILLGEEGPSKEQIATTGRVKVRVDATAGAIRVGDLLVTGYKAGMAMKSTPLDLHGVAIHRPGTLIGKALEPLESGEGEILVLLSLQ